MSTTATDSKITATESDVVDLPAGVPEGTIDKDNETVPEAVRARIEHRETVVHEYDKDGNVIGWHKTGVTE